MERFSGIQNFIESTPLRFTLSPLFYSTPPSPPSPIHHPLSTPTQIHTSHIERHTHVNAYKHASTCKTIPPPPLQIPFPPLSPSYRLLRSPEIEGLVGWLVGVAPPLPPPSPPLAPVLPPLPSPILFLLLQLSSLQLPVPPAGPGSVPALPWVLLHQLLHSWICRSVTPAFTCVCDIQRMCEREET